MTPTHDVLGAAQRSLCQTRGDKPPAAEVVSLLVRNQVPLLSLVDPDDSIPECGARAQSSGDVGNAEPGSAAVLRSSSFRSTAATQRRAYRETHDQFVRVALDWERNGVRSLCFKSAGIPPSFPYTSENYDILFRPGDAAGAREVLMRAGYVELRNCDEPQKWLFRLFEAGRSLCAIHLHTRVGWGQGFMLEDEIWRRCRQSVDDPVTWIPGPEDVVMINVAHAFYENRAFSLHDLTKIRHAVDQGLDWEYLDHVARARGWLPGLHFGLAMVSRLERRLFDRDVIRQSDWERFEHSVRSIQRVRVELQRAKEADLEMPFMTSWALSKRLFFQKITRDRYLDVAGKPVQVVLTLARAAKSMSGARPQNSGLFTLSGVDGSGKTRQAEALFEACSTCALRTRIMWARLGATPLMHGLSRFRRRQMSHGVGPPASTPSPAARSGAAMAVWGLLSTADFILWLFHVRWRLIRGDVVIADRYLCDFDVELSLRLHANPSYRTWLMRTVSLVAPTPTEAFLLRIGAIAARRRASPDSGDLEAEDAVRLYDEKAPLYGLTVLDANLPFESMSALIERQSLRTYFQQYGMLGNLLLFSNPWQLNRPAEKSQCRGEHSTVTAAKGAPL